MSKGFGQKGKSAKSAGLKIDIGDAELAFKLLVSSNCAGKIIGRGGSEIAALRRNLGVGCHIHGPHACFPNTDLQVAVLFGARASIEYSLSGMVGKIAEANQEFMLAGGAPEQELAAFVVMGVNAVSALIGTRGATIASVRQSSGCKVSADPEKFNGEQIVRVTGHVDNLPGALTMLTEFVMRSGDWRDLALMEYPPTGQAVVAQSPAKGPKGSGKKGGPQAFGFGGMDARRLAPRLAPQLSPQWGPQLGPRGQKRPHEELVQGELGAAPGEMEPDLAAALGGGLPREDIPDEVELPDEADELVSQSRSTIAFTIPKDAIGRVLGKGGSSASAIRAATGATLSIEPNEVEGVVTVKGALDAVHRAHRLIIGRVLAAR